MRFLAAILFTGIWEQRLGFSLIASLSIVVVSLCRNCFPWHAESYFISIYVQATTVTLTLGTHATNQAHFRNAKVDASREKDSELRTVVCLGSMSGHETTPTYTY